MRPFFHWIFQVIGSRYKKKDMKFLKKELDND